MRIYVTKKDIVEATESVKNGKGPGSDCPIALATKRRLPKASGWGTAIITCLEEDRVMLNSFANAFDREDPVVPFSFTIPKEAAERYA